MIVLRRILIAALLVLITSGESSCSCDIDSGGLCLRRAPRSGGPEVQPSAPPPLPVVSTNNADVGLAAYAENRNVVVHRFDEQTGFGTPQTVVSGTGAEEDLDVVVAGNTARIVWVGLTEVGQVASRISAVSGDLQTGTWNAPVDLVERGADDPVFARGRHTENASSVVV